MFFGNSAITSVPRRPACVGFGAASKIAVTMTAAPALPIAVMTLMGAPFGRAEGIFILRALYSMRPHISGLLFQAPLFKRLWRGARRPVAGATPRPLPAWKLRRLHPLNHRD